MVELLEQHTRLRVVAVSDQLQLQPDTVYVMQPRTIVRIEDGRLRVSPAERINLRPIDTLFESMAQACGSACAAVVLSGTGQDGTHGLSVVKQAGGITIAQRPETARFDGMPQSALAGGAVDLMLAPDEILADIRAHLLDPDPVLAGDRTGQLRWLGTIFAGLRAHTGIDFSHYKLGTIGRRVERRMLQRKAHDLESYAKLVQQSRDEALALQRDLLIGVTAFMRDAAAIDVLRSVAIPHLLGSTTDGPLRVWVAGCSTGEEAYSIAMLIDAAVRAENLTRDLKVFATDIHEQALERASQGKFSAESVGAIPEELVSRYLVPEGGEYVVTKTLRERMLFSRHNVVTDPPFPRINLVSCRNLLIYLKPRIQQRVLATLSSALTQDGLLWLGSSEALGERAQDFDVLDARWKLYRAKPGRPRKPASVLTSPAMRREPARATRSDNTQETATGLLNSLLPPTLVVQDNLALAYRYGNLDDLLQATPGKVTLDVREQLPHALATVVSIACQRARTSDEELSFPGLAVSAPNGTVRSYDLRVHPIFVQGRRLIALKFFPSPDLPEPSAQASLVLDSEMQSRMRTLEGELRESQLHLQSTIEELESSNEELQATNEELVTSNEELQSTNEELQSVNEELHTINAEHSQRLDELTQITQDLDQLLSTLDVGVVFLDPSLQIRRFNKRATTYINVLPQDMGRPLKHLTHTLQYPHLLADCEHVIATNEVCSCNVPTENARVNVRIHAVRGQGGRPKGLVITIAPETAEQ
jgi:two-component system CheB/CheR fusion protein